MRTIMRAGAASDMVTALLNVLAWVTGERVLDSVGGVQSVQL